MRKQRRLSIESLESRDNPAPVIPGFTDDGSTQVESVSDQEQHDVGSAATEGDGVGDGGSTQVEPGVDLQQQSEDSAATVVESAGDKEAKPASEQPAEAAAVPVAAAAVGNAVTAPLPGAPGGPTVSTTAEGSFVERIYFDLLGRRPDSFAQRYVEDLASGVRSREEVAEEIAHSDEYLTLVVTNLYNTFLHRAPEEGGLHSYVRDIQDGKSVEDVVVEILSTQEYRAQFTSGTAYVNAVYRDVFGRTTTPSQIEDYVDRYGGGSQGDAEGVAREIVESDEARGNAVDAAFALMLNRPADPLSRIAYIGGLETGRSILDILAEMANSAEYDSTKLLI